MSGLPATQISRCTCVKPLLVSRPCPQLLDSHGTVMNCLGIVLFLMEMKSFRSPSNLYPVSESLHIRISFSSSVCTSMRHLRSYLWSSSSPDIVFIHCLVSARALQGKKRSKIKTAVYYFIKTFHELFNPSSSRKNETIQCEQTRNSEIRPRQLPHH
jgi:hypothetical protein